MSDETKMTVTSLDMLAPGEQGRIIKISGRGAVQRRLVDMGLTSGAIIKMVKPSPLGDPIEYRIRGYHLSLRRSEAKNIEVELVAEEKSGNGVTSIPETIRPLLVCKPGQPVVIDQIRGGRKVRGRLNQIGLDPGTVLRVISNDFPGPLIVSVDNHSRQVLGKGLAWHILVKPI